MRKNFKNEVKFVSFAELVAEFPLLEGRLTLSQSVPPAPVFLTFCFSKTIAPTLNTSSRLVKHLTFAGTDFR